GALETPPYFCRHYRRPSRKQRSRGTGGEIDQRARNPYLSFFNVADRTDAGSENIEVVDGAADPTRAPGAGISSIGDEFVGVGVPVAAGVVVAEHGGVFVG